MPEQMGSTLIELPAASKRERRAFTLIELLVVVGILSLLIGLLFPTFTGIRKLARCSACASQLRALQTGVTQYMAANRFQTTGTDFQFSNWVADIHWEIWWADKGRENIRAGQIWDYVKNYETYLCPDFEAVCRRPPAGAEWRPGVPYGQGYNGWGGSVPSMDPGSFEPVRSYGQSEYVGYDATRLAQLDTSKTVWLSDENPWRQLGGYPQWAPAFGINNAHIGYDDAPGEYHNGKANCSFADGHVGKLTPLEVRDNVRGN